MCSSSPDSPNYGKHWSMEQVHETFAPADEAVDAVREWLLEFGIHNSRVVHSDNKGWLAFDASVDEAEKLLLAEFHEHEHEKTSKLAVGCDQYHIPEHLKSHIGYITPGVKFTPVVKRTVNPQNVTLYQVDDKVYEQTALGFNIFLDALDGSYCTSSAYGETGNDPTIDGVYPDPVPGGYKGKLQCGTFKPTNVISISYGESEADLPLNYARRQCDEFMKLALQGHSILISSGDFGVAGVAGFPGDPSANGCLGPDSTIFNPGGFVDCPYVTAVGGTMLYADQTINDAESVMQINLGGAAANFSSGGGFSNYFPSPNYPQDAVETYFKRAKLTYLSYSEMNVDVTKTEGLFNRIGRAYPDVAANGANLPAPVGLHIYHWFGTSLSSPIFASILTLLNEERFAIGKGPIGFVNPVLYANPDVLIDVTNGTDLGCGSNGFQAIKGWDPVTGLGTPDYPKMKKLFLSLP